MAKKRFAPTSATFFADSMSLTKIISWRAWVWSQRGYIPPTPCCGRIRLVDRYRCAAWTWQMKTKKNIHGENCNWTDWFFNVSPHKCFTMLESYWSESNPASMACSNHTQHVPTEIVYISYLLWYLISVCKSVCTHSGKDLCSNKYIYIYI